MSGTEIVPTTGQIWKWKTLTIGAVIGALAGLTAAYLLIQRAENEGETPKLSAGEGVKLGALVLGLLRQVSQLGS
jgi:hypothetical protein